MTTHTAPPPPAPADLDARLVRFLGALHDRADLSPDRIATATGLPVAADPGNPHRYGFGVGIGDGWVCQLASIPDFDGTPPRRLVLSYDDLAGRFDPALPDAAPDYAALSQQLRDAGYDEHPIPGPRGAIWGHRFVRQGVAIEVQTERAPGPSEAARFRVSRLVVDATLPVTEVHHG